MHHQKRRRATFRVPKTHAACFLFGHQWETTIGSGMFACRRCDLTAFCPGCSRILPDDHIRRIACSLHQGRPPQQPSSHHPMFCPECTPQVPDNAQPLFCSVQTSQRQVD